MVHTQFTMAIVITSINGKNHSIIIIGKNDERHGPFLGPSQIINLISRISLVINPFTAIRKFYTH